MNVLILLYLVGIAPKLLFDRVWRKKRHPGLLQRLGFSIPQNQGRPTIWIHAVSVGEVKAAQPLFRELKKRYPYHFFLITTTTATGQAEAKRSLPQADAHAYLPVDLSWVVHRWISQLNPELFLFIEGDFWPNLLSKLKENGTKIALVSGKMSARSAKRFQFFSSFSKKLFSHFDLICTQNEEHNNRFAPFVDPNRLFVTGNLKLDIEPQKTDTLALRKQIPPQAITISCTHFPEESLLLKALAELDLFIFLAPRHPERFEEVAQLLAEQKISFIRWAQFLQGQIAPATRVVLVDTMGELPTCYTLSRLAIVAGSYAEQIGGHNVLEPCLYGTPVFFGPHTFTQKEFARLALQAGAGQQTPLEALSKTLQNFFQNPSLESEMRASAQRMISENKGATSRTLAALNKTLGNN